MSRKLTTEDFIKLAKEKWGDTYCYDKTEYGNNNKILITITCRIHGDFQQKPNSHLTGSACNQCRLKEAGKRKIIPFEKFKERAAQIHNNFYSYQDNTYLGSENKMVINCPVHGLFQQTPNKHLKGQGCRECRKIKMSELMKNNTHSSWTRERWIESFGDRKCIFYIIKCSNNSEEFIKIGITSRKLKERFSNFERMPYKFSVLKEEEMTAAEVWDEEIKFKIENKKYNYIPKQKFHGSLTECFKF